MLGQRCWVRGAGSDVLGQRCWVRGAGSEVLGQRCSVRGTGSEVLSQRCWIRGAGSELLGQNVQSEVSEYAGIVSCILIARTVSWLIRPRQVTLDLCLPKV